MDIPKDISTEDAILIRARRSDMRSWHRTLEQIRNPEVALDQIQNQPFDWEDEDVF